MSKIIGIDLGTTNSVVAVMEGGQPVVIPNPEGGRTTPSIVGFKSGERLVGPAAKRQMLINPEQTIYSIKRFMGRRYEEVLDEIQRIPYRITRGPHEDVRVEVEEKTYTPPEISAMILRYLKEAAEGYLGEKVEKAVITVPAYFNDAQRQATKDAGTIAGLEVVRLVNEPTAAALAYGFDKKKDQVIAVFDFGGGTFDISILEIGEGVIEVKSTAGDTHLGGDDIDRRLVEWVIEEFKKDAGIDLHQDRMALQRIRDAVEKAKIELSSALETEINLPFITADNTGPKHIQMRLTRAKFESLVMDILERTLEPCKQALADAKLRADQIDAVILVGGSTRIPKVQEIVRGFFGKDPHKGVNPDEVVAVGAAIQAGILAGELKDILLLDVTPLSLGVETLGGVVHVLIPRNTTIPTRRSETFTTAADNQTQVEIHVLQGERPMAQDNRTLARFILDGIPPAPRGVPQIEVTFDIDANGILHVNAKDMATQKEQRVTVTASSGLTKEEIEKMVKEAEAHAEEDRTRKEEIEQRNRIDQMIYQSEKLLAENRERIEENLRNRLEGAVKDAKEAMKEGGVERLKNAADNLMKANNEVAVYLYQRAGAAQSTSGSATASSDASSPSSQSGGGEVIDAEVVEDDRR